MNQKEFDKKTLQPILAILSKHLNVSIDWNVNAKLYKFLLYEPGCFFRLHRDTERIDDMFGTLVIQLPSEYTGDSLSVRNPLLPTSEHAKTLNFSEGKGTFYAAFYADCIHEVTKPATGDRCCLVYSLVGAKKKIPRTIDTHMGYKKHISLAREIASAAAGWKDDDKVKLVATLQHQYTTSSLEKWGMNALKGQDPYIAELLAYARHITPDAGISTLAELAARTIAYGPIKPEEHSKISEILNFRLMDESKLSEEPLFDVVLTTIVMHEFWAEGWNAVPFIAPKGATFFTTGPFISLYPNDHPPPRLPRHLPPRETPCKTNCPRYYITDLITRIDGDEMLSSTLGPGKGRFEEGTVKSFTNINNGYGNKTKSVEFLGNGGPPDEASFYTRAGIVLCPRQNRTKVVEQAVDADVENTGFHALGVYNNNLPQDVDSE
ncbi:hypothetical protein TL16_g08723 [Triparma laevis f. inornata]|uniref:Prolyl 4-hydroxylase alpha subunit Fe(2+) 2OG dioxygenase domain-containing protein n=1 Tax=Triparma laevis f. inornata TaxID=1714386 RepID=A0A9W7AXQ4_9STRA|nr:hypothetical protein TL16_g08723 [Triparma laevis f. inornata]